MLLFLTPGWVGSCADRSDLCKMHAQQRRMKVRQHRSMPNPCQLPPCDTAWLFRNCRLHSSRLRYAHSAVQRSPVPATSSAFFSQTPCSPHKCGVQNTADSKSSTLLPSNCHSMRWKASLELAGGTLLSTAPAWSIEQPYRPATSIPSL